jgi:hypothetical protein
VSESAESLFPELVMAQVAANGHMKRCPACGRWLPVREFGRNRAKADRMGVNCRTCEDKYRTRRRGFYGLLVRRFGKVCWFCGERYGPMIVHHDHETGAVLALTCRNHNTGLGTFNDDPDELALAADWLRSVTAVGWQGVEAPLRDKGWYRHKRSEDDE